MSTDALESEDPILVLSRKKLCKHTRTIWGGNKLKKRELEK